MKKGLLFVLFAMVSVLSYSQISWNVKAGMNFSNWTKGDLDSKVGFKVGGGFEYAFNDIFAIQPSLMLSTKGAKFPDEFADALVEELLPGTSFDEAKVSINQIYIELPVMAAARFKIGNTSNIVISAGPYFAYGVGGDAKITVDGQSVTEGVFSDEGLDRLDIGLGVGLAFEFSKFVVGVEAQYGLTKLADIYGSPKNKNLSLSVGYKF